jgi:hypothetical protein
MLKVTPRYLIRRKNGRGGGEECGTHRFLFKQNDLHERDGDNEISTRFPFKEEINGKRKEDRNESYT